MNPGGVITEIVVILDPELARSFRSGLRTDEALTLEEQLSDLGVELSALFPDVEPELEELVTQFSGHLPDDVVDERLQHLRALSGVEAAYKKPPAELPTTDAPGL